jgi:hypothetical protein
VHRRVAVPAWLVAVAIATPTAIGAGALLDGSDERVAAPDGADAASTRPTPAPAPRQRTVGVDSGVVGHC